jgi:type IV secretion system protein TrbL
MNDFSAIDGFLTTFITYIDSGFGLISGDVTSLAAILIVIDVTLAALFWAWGQNDILQSLVKKTLYVGAFAFIFGNFAMLSTIVFDSFATLGLNAAAASFSPADLLKPGLVAAEGLAASQPIFDHIGTIAPGPFEFFGNLAEVILLCLGGIIVIAAFFVLSIQLFVLIVEFKITTLAGFVLVPFAFWKQTTFLAERVLGNVISSGIKVLVIAVVIGIGSTMFATLRTALSPDDMTIEQAFAVVLGALTLMGLAIFCPRIAAGLVSGAPQLSAGAAAGTAIGVGAAGMPALTGRACGCWRDSWRQRARQQTAQRPPPGAFALQPRWAPCAPASPVPSLRRSMLPWDLAPRLLAVSLRQQAASPVTSERAERQASALLLARPARSRHRPRHHQLRVSIIRHIWPARLGEPVQAHPGDP